MQGHIRKRTHKTKAGKETVNWYVVVELGRDANAKRRQKWHGGYRTRKEAEVARTKIVGDLHAGTYTEPTKLTLREWVEDKWLPTVRTQVKPSTFDSYQRNIHLHVLPALGGRSLVDIGPGQLNTLYVDLLEHGRRNGPGGLSPKTVHYIHTMVHKALADAVDGGLIAANAAGRAKPPRPRSAAPKELLFWAPEQLRSFLDLVARHRLEAAWNVSAMTGMRRGEVLGLRWADLDLNSSRIHVRQALVSVAYKLIVSTPKNHLARVIDLDPATVEQIRLHRQRQLAEQEEWGDGYRDGDLLFCKENGEPIHPQTLSQAFERLVDKSDLPRIHLHCLRHTHATIALRAGVPPKVISERLGHESPAFTLKQYAHVIPGMQADAARAIADLVASSN
ncbi:MULTISPECIES: tyrosine-type recombinase/integrase [Candidatus Microthrix]|jgi:integrase|uniref:Putative Integrase family protein n=1 Tax=Candidatus Neomicrothrix parvicella RN1 TaxID=1229780 RepID=R4Z3R6_9ACTN|nr:MULTISPECIES: tyrosine-type recombinase/integrase [Microthrix]MBK6501510.1 site-specific integrase [Candidatus Microthrix sp.]MBK7020146.1 site-specific integrase [Candidatus Microthrix sp.]MBP8181104.1 site-specific integrase [Acidimicrobiia bacterium]CCM65290.1 putative Integrase family protein [Candidatus Microthrix parvicella RN1]